MRTLLGVYRLRKYNNRITIDKEDALGADLRCQLLPIASVDPFCYGIQLRHARGRQQSSLIVFELLVRSIQQISG